ncbi:hypothetical protein DPV78_008261 [Talaromyces pinophilus]|nr:hypothetical protein DPV78_008261 [Talaromyces pinophilus]
MLGLMFVYKLVDYVFADNVIINVVDPGTTRGTGLKRDLPKAVAAVAKPLVFGITRSVRDLCFLI